MQHFDKSLLHL